MSRAILRGREHTRMHWVDVVSEGATAIAISRGGAHKPYHHLDDNEDAAGFWRGTEGIVLAVADGHNGFEASEVAVEYVLRDPAPQWGEPGGVDASHWERQAAAALCDANRSVLTERSSDPAVPSRTTLAIAMVKPREHALFFACCGDSELFLVEDEQVRPLCQPGSVESFLGFAERDPRELRKLAQIGVVSLRGVAAVVAVTDGLTEVGIGVSDPCQAIFEAADRAAERPAPERPALLARLVCEAATSAHHQRGAGDNVAAAVHWLV